MKPSRVLKVLPQLLKNRWPAFVWGPPGVGKSSVVKQVAEELKLPILDVRASLLDPTDLRGIPSVVDGRAVWAPPSFLPTPKQPAGILFFDELNAAPPLVQASLLQLTLDHRVGEYILPPGWRIVAAGNRAEDRSVTFRMPSALANRFIHLDFEADFEDWKAWAYRNGVHPLVVAFLSTRRELLFKRSKDDRAFPTPRSWEMASDVIRTLGPGKASMDVLAGVVGDGAAAEIVGYCEGALREEELLKIIEKPESESLPTKLGDLYALVSYLILRAEDAGVRRSAGILLGRLPAEMAVLLARDLLRVFPRFSADAGYKEFVKKRKDLLTES